MLSVPFLSSTLTLPLQNILSIPIKIFPKSHICFAISPSNQNPLGEEARWVREEQRWLREEQRWLRAESRWNAERHVLLLEISSLKLRIQELERLNSLQGASVSESVANSAKLLQNSFFKNVNRIAESGSYAVPLVVEAAKQEEEVIVKEIIISIPDKMETAKKMSALREESEENKVRAMQKVVSEEGVTEFLISQNRVFLLGENRWEEPSRLFASKQHFTKCISCRGEGRSLCMECDGTGEPNIEPQFMEWFDDEARCPYCNGIGYTTCNVCGVVK